MLWATERVATVGSRYRERGEGTEGTSNSLEKCKNGVRVFLFTLKCMNCMNIKISVLHHLRQNGGEFIMI